MKRIIKKKLNWNLKRYSDQQIIIKGEKFYVRLISFGHSKRTKIVSGINTIAQAFGKMMMDYVYCFLEKKEDSVKYL